MLPWAARGHRSAWMGPSLPATLSAWMEPSFPATTPARWKSPRRRLRCWSRSGSNKRPLETLQRPLTTVIPLKQKRLLDNFLRPLATLQRPLKALSSRKQWKLLDILQRPLTVLSPLK